MKLPSRSDVLAADLPVVVRLTGRTPTGVEHVVTYRHASELDRDNFDSARAAAYAATR